MDDYVAFRCRLQQSHHQQFLHPTQLYMLLNLYHFRNGLCPFLEESFLHMNQTHLQILFDQCGFDGTFRPLSHFSRIFASNIISYSTWQIHHFVIKPQKVGHPAKLPDALSNRVSTYQRAKVNISFFLLL